MVQQACWQTPSAHSSCSGAPWSCNSFRRCQCQTKEARHGSDLHQAPSALRSGRAVNKSTHSYREGASSARRRRRTMRCAQPPPLTSTVMRMMKKVHVSITSPLPSGANANDQEIFTREAWQPPNQMRSSVHRCCQVGPGRSRLLHVVMVCTHQKLRRILDGATHQADPVPPAATARTRWRPAAPTTTASPA